MENIKDSCERAAAPDSDSSLVGKAEKAGEKHDKNNQHDRYEFTGKLDKAFYPARSCAAGEYMTYSVLRQYLAGVRKLYSSILKVHDAA